jgi:peptide/nickel transport system permease protein
MAPDPGPTGRSRSAEVTRTYLLRRLGEAVVTLFGVAVVVFLLLRVLPGDEVTARVGIEAGAMTETQREALRAYYGLDQPLWQQFWSWVTSVLQGNFGVSTGSGRPVSDLLTSALPVTLQLALMASVIGITVGVLVGVFAASRPDSLRDTTGQTFGLLGLGVPDFVLASAIVAVLSARFGYFPSAGDYARLTEAPLVNLQQLLYPALVLGLGLAATVMRTTRSAYLEVAGQDFVRTARGKGVEGRRIRFKHVLRNATIPIVTISGIQFGYLLGGTIIVEEIFALPGMGRLVLTGIAQREYAVVQSTVLVIATGFVVVNLLVDLLYARLDPRVRLT